MKTLKFTPELADMILRKEKTATWRLFDDKDLMEGDEVEFINKGTGEVFGHATIVSMRIKTLGTLSKEDWEGHEQFDSKEEMYATYRSYYGDRVGPNSELKILSFTFTPLT